MVSRGEAPRRPQDTPRRFQDAPRRLQDAPRRPQDPLGSFRETAPPTYLPKDPPPWDAPGGIRGASPPVRHDVKTKRKRKRRTPFGKRKWKSAESKRKENESETKDSERILSHADRSADFSGHRTKSIDFYWSADRKP